MSINNPEFMSALYMFFYFISRPLSSINYVKCRCGICINCFKYDGKQYHNKNRECKRDRICLECKKYKDELQRYDLRGKLTSDAEIYESPSILKGMMIDFYICLFMVLMIPVTIMNFVTYYIFNLSKMILDLLHLPVYCIDYNDYSVYTYGNYDGNVERIRLIIDEFFELNIIEKIMNVVRYLFNTTCVSVGRNMNKTNTSNDDVLVLLMFAISVNLCYAFNYVITIKAIMLLNVAVLFFVSLFRLVLIAHLFEFLLSFIIHIPRVVLTIIMYTFACMYSLNSYHLEMNIINQCAYPFLRMNIMYDGKHDANTHSVILTKEVSFIHILCRILLVVPTFIYYFLKGMINMIISLVFGESSKNENVGILFEVEQFVFSFSIY